MKNSKEKFWVGLIWNPSNTIVIDGPFSNMFTLSDQDQLVQPKTKARSPSPLSHTLLTTPYRSSRSTPRLSNHSLTHSLTHCWHQRERLSVHLVRDGFENRWRKQKLKNSIDQWLQIFSPFAYFAYIFRWFLVGKRRIFGQVVLLLLLVVFLWWNLIFNLFLLYNFWNYISAGDRIQVLYRKMFRD